MFQFLKNLFGEKQHATKPTIAKSTLSSKAKTSSKPIAKTTSKPITKASSNLNVKASSKPKPKAAPSTPLVSNAPAHWPVLTLDNALNMFPAGDARNWLTGSLMHAGAILTALKEHHGEEGKSSYKENVDLVEGDIAVSSSVQQLCSLGLLKVDVAVREKGQKYAVIIFENGVSKSTVETINKAIQSYGYNELIWYAHSEPDALGKVELPTMQFDRTSITHIKNYKSKYAQYAMWWSSPNDAQFTMSKAAEYINRFYETVDGYETSMNGLFGVMFKMHPQIDRVDLPDDLVIPFEGPGSEVILLGIGKKRGFNFYFPVNDRTTTYRDDFLREFIPFTKEMIGLMKERKYKQDRWPNMPIEWWKHRLEKAKVDESNESENKMMTIFEPIRKNDASAN